MTWTKDLADSLNAPESGLKLVIGQLSAYPLMVLYRSLFAGNSSRGLHHAYLALTGLFMSYWAIGSDAVFHSSLCVAITWLTLKVTTWSSVSNTCS